MEPKVSNESVLKQFLYMISPTLELSDIIQSIDALFTEIEESTYPALNDIIKTKIFVGTEPFKSTIMKRFNTNYRLALDKPTKHNFIGHAHLVFNGLIENKDNLYDNINQHFKGKVFSKTGLTYPKATLLRLLNLMQFAARYTRRILLYTYAEEIPKAFQENPTTKEFTPGEINWFKDNERHYFAVMNILSLDMEDILFRIAKMPDIPFDPEKEAASEIIKGKGSFDPMKMGYVPVLGPVMLFFGSRFVTWQAENLLALREEKELLDLQLAQLQYAHQGHRDAAHDKLIELKKERVKNLNYKIAKIEKSWGVE